MGGFTGQRPWLPELYTKEFAILTNHIADKEGERWWQARSNRPGAILASWQCRNGSILLPPISITVVLLCVYLLQMRGTFGSETLWDCVVQVTLELMTWESEWRSYLSLAPFLFLCSGVLRSLGSQWRVQAWVQKENNISSGKGNPEFSYCLWLFLYYSSIINSLPEDPPPQKDCDALPWLCAGMLTKSWSA